MASFQTKSWLWTSVVDASQLAVSAVVKHGSTVTLDVDLNFPAQGVTAILGPSGSGKTTLLRAIAGLTRPAPGRIALGSEIWQNEYKPGSGFWLPAYRRPIGFVFQEASLFDHLSVVGNLKFGLHRATPGRKRIELGQAIELLGIATLLDRRPAQLSGGERQRVAIARALAAAPALLLMDEPLAALDAARKAELLPYFEQLALHGSIPILYVTHAVDEAARLSQRLLILEHGRVAAFGNTADVLTRLNVALAQSDNAGAILDGIVDGIDPIYGLMTVRFGLEYTGSIQCLPTVPPKKIGSTVRLRVLARDVSVTLSAASDTSILNVVAATVQEIATDGSAQVLLRLSSCGAQLLARITRKSADTLALTLGSIVYAQIKGVAVLD
jgi:molybdate transport system ATP-binding protein